MVLSKLADELRLKAIELLNSLVAQGRMIMRKVVDAIWKPCSLQNQATYWQVGSDNPAVSLNMLLLEGI